MRFAAGLFALAAIALPSVPAFGAVAIPISSLITSFAGAAAVGTAGEDSSYHYDSWTTVPAALAANSTGSVFGYYGTAIATTAITANWTSSDAGTIAIDYQSLVSTPDGPIGNWDGYGRQIITYSYQFTAETDAVFHLDYDISSSFSRSGTPTNESVYEETFLTPTGSSLDEIPLSGVGSLDYDLIAGQAYSIFLVADPNFFTNASGILAGSQRYSFTITEKTPEPPPIGGGVPEPGTWALMLAGFGLVGSAIRRQRPQFAL